MPIVSLLVLLRRWRRKLVRLEGEIDESLDIYEACKRVNGVIETASCVDAASNNE